jgi:hypothetical protein
MKLPTCFASQPKHFLDKAAVAMKIAVPTPDNTSPIPRRNKVVGKLRRDKVVGKLGKMIRILETTHTIPPATIAMPIAKNEKITAEIVMIRDIARRPMARANGTAIGEANNAKITSHAKCQFFLTDFW